MNNNNNNNNNNAIDNNRVIHVAPSLGNHTFQLDYLVTDQTAQNIAKLLQEQCNPDEELLALQACHVLIRGFFNKTYNAILFKSVLLPLIERLRNNGKFNEHDYVVDNLWWFMLPDLRSKPYADLQDAWQIFVQIQLLKFQCVYMRRRFDECEVLRNQIDLGLVTLYNHTRWNWIKVARADMAILLGAWRLKQDDLKLAERELNTGLVNLSSVENEKWSNEEKTYIYKAKSRLQYYKARVLARALGEEAERGLMCNVDFEYHQSALAAKRSQNEHLYVEFTLQRLQYLLCCSTYQEFLCHREIEPEALIYCESALSEISQSPALEGSLRTKQVFNLTEMNLFIRKKDLLQFNRAGMEINDSVQYGNPDTMQYVRDRCMVVQASWMKTPLVRPEIVNIHTHQVLHQGISGKVYLGIDDEKQVYAVKRYIIHTSRGDIVAEELAQMFRNHLNCEQFVLLTLKGHRNIVELKRTDVVDPSVEGCSECYQLVMEYASRGDLKKYLETVMRGRFPPQERVKIVSDIGEGLWELHRNGFIYRDVKPQNLLVFTDEAGEIVVKWCDFADTVLVDSRRRFQEDRPTRPKNSVYVDPLLVSRPIYGQFSDVYSFGVLFAQIMLNNLEISQEHIQLEKSKCLAAKLASYCVDEDICRRPSMEEAMCVIRQYKERLLVLDETLVRTTQFNFRGTVPINDDF